MDVMARIVLIIASLFCGVIISIVSAKAVLRDAKKRADVIIASAKSEVNQFASLPPEQLNAELGRVLSMILSREIITYISERDQNGDEELYARAMASFMDYFSGSVKSIDLRYGKDYLLKWFDLHYTTMQCDGTIDRTIKAKLSG